MAFTYGFYNAIDHDRQYDAADFSRLFDGIIADGIFADYEKGFKVVRTNNNIMEVKVCSGRAWFNHTWNFNDSDVIMTIDASDQVKNRMDAVVIEVNLESRTNSLKIIKGTPVNGTPGYPSLSRSNNLFQYALAYVTVNAQVTSIPASAINDARGKTINNLTTPFSHGILRQLDSSSIFGNWQSGFDEMISDDNTEFNSMISNQTSRFNSMISSQTSEFNTMITDQTNEFNSELENDRQTFMDWFENLHIVLSEDVATNLQMEIEDLYSSILNFVDNNYDIDNALNLGTYLQIQTATSLNNSLTRAISAAGLTYNGYGLFSYGDLEKNRAYQIALVNNNRMFYRTFNPSNSTWNAWLNVPTSTEVNSKAPTSHASSATTYGLGTGTLYGHVKTINNLTQASHQDGTALSAYQGKVLNDKITTLTNGKAPTNHASTASTYGLGTTSNYGHVKTINGLTQASHQDGTALSAYQGKVLDDKITTINNNLSRFGQTKAILYKSSGTPVWIEHEYQNILEKIAGLPIAFFTLNVTTLGGAGSGEAEIGYLPTGWFPRNEININLKANAGDANPYLKITTNGKIYLGAWLSSRDLGLRITFTYLLKTS